MNDRPAASISLRFASEIIPASATTGDVWQVVRGHERLDDRQHRLGLRGVALERGHHQREPRGVGEQADRHLRLQAAFLGEPALPEPVPSVGLEIQGADVIEHQAGPAQPRVRGARRRQAPPPRFLRVGGQAALKRGIRRRADPGLVQHPQAVQFAGRLDDPREHQQAEHLVPARRPVQPQHPVGALQGVQKVPRPRGRDRQRAASGPSAEARAERKLTLPGRHPLPRRGPQQLQLRVIVRGPDVLDVPRSPVRGVHDLHRPRARGGPHRPHVRHTRPPYGLGLVRRFAHHERGIHRSTR
jgi:hypothetical protein